MFDGNEQLESTVDLPENPEPWSKYFTPTYNPQDESIPTPVIKLRKTMEAAEKAVSSKLRKLASRMRSYAPNQLSSGSVEWHKSYIDSVREFYLDLYDSIEDLCDDFSSELSPSRLQHWKDQLPKIDRDFQNYMESFKPKLDQIKEAIQPSQPSGQTLGGFQAEQLKLMKQQNEIAMQNKTDASNETLRENNAKKVQGVKKAKTKRDLILNNVDELSDAVNKVSYWEEEEDLSISRGMRNIAVWRKDLEKITATFNEFSDICVTNDLGENRLR